MALIQTLSKLSSFGKNTLQQLNILVHYASKVFKNLNFQAYSHIGYELLP